MNERNAKKYFFLVGTLLGIIVVVVGLFFGAMVVGL